ncbi:MAG TPA: phosphatase PAP2 family protein [Vicinamibacterales bacterium]
MRSSTLVLAVVIALSATGVFAQEVAQPPQDPAQKPPAAVGEEATKPTRGFFSSLGHNLKDDVKHLPRKNSLYFLVGGSAVALLVHPNDNKINRRLEGSGAAETFFKPGKIIGETPVLAGAGMAAYLIGRGKGNGRLQHLGMDEIEAQILTDAIVYGMKEAVRRKRPIRSDGTRASGFSFPSGHAAATFAAATVLQQHLGYRAGIPTYLIATYVAMSRLHENVHKASDVVMGATVGLIVGRTVTWHGRNFYASPMLLPKGGGIIVNVNAAPSLSNPRH